MLLAVAFWVAFTCLFAYGQGRIMPTLKQVPPNTPEANRNNFALHWIFGAVWALPVLLVWYYTHRWELAAIAVLLRFVCFDVVLNKAEGNMLFVVGSEANTDKMLRKIAGLTGVPVTYLSAILKGIALCVLVWIIWREMLINN